MRLWLGPWASDGTNVDRFEAHNNYSDWAHVPLTGPKMNIFQAHCMIMAGHGPLIGPNVDNFQVHYSSWAMGP